MGQSLSHYGSGVSDFPPWIENLAITLAMIWLATIVILVAFLFCLACLAYLAFWGIKCFWTEQNQQSNVYYF